MSPRATLKDTAKDLAPPAAAAKSKNQLRNDLDNLPPVQFRHQLIDMGSFAIALAMTVTPMTCYKYIPEEIGTDLKSMLCIAMVYSTIQYWVLAGYFMLCEHLGLCHDMFVTDPKNRITFADGGMQVIKNQMIALPCIGGYWAFLYHYYGPESFEQMPSAMQAIGYMAKLAFFWSELHMYVTHRAFHTPALMRFHKMHHEQNNVSLTVAWGARYCSVVEDLVCNIAAIAIYPFMFSLHPGYYMSWISLAQWNVIANHTGYYEKYLPVTAAITGMVHHNHHSNGNADFGTTVGWADWLFKTKGTNHPGSVFVGVIDAVWVKLGGTSRL